MRLGRDQKMPTGIEMRSRADGGRSPVAFISAGRGAVLAVAAVFLICAAPVFAADGDIVRNGNKCGKFLPNIGRMVDVPCPEDLAPGTPEPPASPPAAADSAAAPLPDVVQLPEKESPLRKELMNAARPAFEYATAGKVIFVVNRIAVWGDWAFGNVRPVRPDGVEINWLQTRFAPALKAGAFQTETSFFLLKRVDGVWTMAEYVVGPTDVTWDGWRQQYNLPPALFGP